MKVAKLLIVAFVLLNCCVAAILFANRSATEEQTVVLLTDTPQPTNTVRPSPTFTATVAPTSTEQPLTGAERDYIREIGEAYVRCAVYMADFQQLNHEASNNVAVTLNQDWLKRATVAGEGIAENCVNVANIETTDRLYPLREDVYTAATYFNQMLIDWARGVNNLDGESIGRASDSLRRANIYMQFALEKITAYD